MACIDFPHAHQYIQGILRRLLFEQKTGKRKTISFKNEGYLRINRDHLCVCICTFKRREMLGHLLDTLKQQETCGFFTYSILVVDNDYEKSAKETIAKARVASPVLISYDVEPIQNISLARNRALKTADGDFLACLDDDEYADKQWLLSLYEAIKKYSADVILGPVLPCFSESPPSWVLRGGLFDRESFPTGTVIKNPNQTRSGNFMISRKMVRDNDDLFDPAFGLIGGEDSDFFKRMLERGYLFIWCQEARVFETVPSSRVTRTYLLKRALMRGAAAAKRGPLISTDTFLSVIAFISYTIALPFLLLGGHHLFMRYLIKDCDHLAKLLARFGIKVMRQWPS